MPHMVSVDKYTVNCKEILVEYYFNISLFSALCEIYLRFSLFEAKNSLFFVFYFVASRWYASPSQSFCSTRPRSLRGHFACHRHLNWKKMKMGLLFQTN